MNLFITLAEPAFSVTVDYILNLQAANLMDMISNPFTALYRASSSD